MGTSGSAGPGKKGHRHDVALAVQQPCTEGAATGVEPEHIGVPVAVEVSHSDGLPRALRRCACRPHEDDYQSCEESEHEFSSHAESHYGPIHWACQAGKTSR